MKGGEMMPMPWAWKEGKTPISQRSDSWILIIVIKSLVLRDDLA